MSDNAVDAHNIIKYSLTNTGACKITIMGRIYPELETIVSSN